MSTRCGIEYVDQWPPTPPEEQKIVDTWPGVDRTPVICFREAGHCGSHIAEREAHVTIWDGEMYYDFYAPEGFGAMVCEPRLISPQP